jgi:hypothetical protein
MSNFFRKYRKSIFRKVLVIVVSIIELEEEKVDFSAPLHPAIIIKSGICF